MVTEDVMNSWIRFGMPPVVVYSAYFANSRHTFDATAESLELIYNLQDPAESKERGEDMLRLGVHPEKGQVHEDLRETMPFR